jgi:CDP-diacylglycerol--glycerol-3-phosphate 3-phosphatidyltransferase
MRKRLVTAPNLITLFRVLCLPLVAILIVRGEGWYAGFLIIIAGLSDILDGWIARHYKQESALGTLMDPVADKLLLCVGAIYLVARPEQHFSALVATLLLSREFFVTGLRAVLASVGVVMGAGRLGKFKTLFQISGLVGLMWAISEPIPFFIYGGQALLWISVVLSYGSMAKYSWIAYRELKTKLV